MEGKYTKLGTVVALIALIITIYQIIPEKDKKIDGEWTMISIIKEADLKDYVGMKIKWKIFFNEIDNTIKGRAEKIEVNDKKIDPSLRTSMEIEGNIKENLMTLNYVENGKKRKTSGIMILTLNDDEFNGEFSQTASNTKGEIIGSKN